MAMSASDVMKTIKDKEVKFVDLRFTDTRGKEQHVSVPVKAFTMDKFESGHFFDGSSIAGWKSIEASDMLLMPEPEFFIFDSVTWEVAMSGCFCKIKSEEAPWSSGEEFEGGNMGHRAPIKGGYFPVPPTDTLQDIRNAMVLAMEQQGVECVVHHHEVGAMGQNEIGTKFNSLVKRADWMQILKYTVWNVAHSYGKTATFMPKPVVGDNGSGMHVHQSVWKEGKNLFQGDGYSGLSDFALYYIGGIIKHAKALNAITNPGTNSYKRLVPGFEAPINLAYSSRNRSAACRIPLVTNPKSRRV